MFDASQPISIRDNYPGGVNTPHDLIYDNMRKNIRRMLPQVCYHAPNPYKAMLICGGPSINDFKSEIKKKRKKGWKLITVNGSHNWCLDNGMTPSMHVMLDARPFNKRFVDRPQEACRYMLASQVHPEVYDALDGYDVHIWHAGASSDVEKNILDRYYMKRWGTVTGGTSVGTRAIGLAHLVGIRELEVYGFDCCYKKKQHHAYDQPENDYSNGPWKVRVGRRIFHCDPWMLKQVDELCQWAEVLPNDYKLTFKGDGLASYLISETAEGRNPVRRVL